ncbi:MAG: amino acid permease [Candidatus Omnitrophica bacterium]|nr:amino acid permease [Candidatus Omnitrophota bacterium]
MPSEDKRRIDLSDENLSRRHVVAMEKGALRRLIGTASLFAIGYGDVGSSIYYALGVTTAWAMGAAPLAIAIAGIFFIFTVLTYAELSAALPESGGSQLFARRAFGDVASFIAGWALLLDYVLTAAISAYTVAPYLSYFWPALKTPVGHIGFTVLLLVALGVLNIAGIRESAGVSLTLALMDIVTQAAIIVIGSVLALNLPRLLGQIEWGVAPSWQNLIYGVTIAMVAYTGIEAVSQLSGETVDPGRKVPRAMLMTLGTVLVMYMGISVIALSVMTPQELGGQWINDPIAGIAAHMPGVGPYLAPWITVLGATILTIAANAGMIGASRLAYSMANNYQLPTFFSRLHPRLKTPYLALAAFTAISILVVLIARELKVLADLYNFGAMLAFSMAHLSLLGLRVKEPDLKRPFKLGLNLRLAGRQLPLTALLGFCATFSVWLIVVATHVHGRNLGFIWMGMGCLLYAWYRKRAQLPVMETVQIEKVSVPEYQALAVKSVLVPTMGGPMTENLQVACQFSRDHGAHVTALHVIEVPATLPLDTFLPDKLAAADAALKRAMAIGREFNLQVTTQILQARSAGQAIVDLAAEQDFDLIVVGAVHKHPPSPLPAASSLGATTEYVVRNAHCRVWICKTSGR